MKAYVVLKRNYEYNDETYEASSGGNSVVAYSNRERAHQIIITRTVEQMKKSCSSIVGQ